MMSTSLVEVQVGMYSPPSSLPLLVPSGLGCPGMHLKQIFSMQLACLSPEDGRSMFLDPTASHGRNCSSSCWLTGWAADWSTGNKADGIVLLLNWQNKLRSLSLRANYTDKVTAACRWSYCHLLQIEDVAWSAWRIPYSLIIAFLDQSRYFSFQVASQLYSRGWVDPVPDLVLLKKSGSSGNRTWTSGSVARNSYH
jgi:hypothetical protein